MGFIRDWWILVWWGEAVKARSVQEGKREIRTGAIRTGSQGSVLSLWDRCVLFGHGRKFAKVRRGRDACGMFRQSRNGPDIFGGAG